MYNTLTPTKRFIPANATPLIEINFSIKIYEWLEKWTNLDFTAFNDIECSIVLITRWFTNFLLLYVHKGDLQRNFLLPSSNLMDNTNLTLPVSPPKRWSRNRKNFFDSRRVLTIFECLTTHQKFCRITIEKERSVCTCVKICVLKFNLSLLGKTNQITLIVILIFVYKIRLYESL